MSLILNGLIHFSLQICVGSVDRHISDFPEDGTNSDSSSTSVLTEVRSTLQFMSQYWQYMGQYAEMVSVISWFVVSLGGSALNSSTLVCICFD